MMSRMFFRTANRFTRLAGKRNGVIFAGAHSSSWTGLWEAAAKDIDWFKKPEVTLDQSESPFNKWLVLQCHV